ncbi:MAG: serine acetyltransferase [Muribaculaceae bacterium]|nr:serine acetyltransferase [Muribaculaceae bacterium]
MKDFAIYCAGGFGREVYCLVFRRIKNPDWNFVGFFDDSIEKGTQLQYGVCLGGMQDLNAWPTPIDLCIANGSPKALKHISQSITNPRVSFPNIIDPATSFADPSTNKLGKGNIFAAEDHLSINVEIGNFNVFNSDVGLGHDVKMGDCNVFMPNSKVSGSVNIGNENLIGACSFILQGLKIGNNVTLSPGSILLTKPKDGNTYIGNPAKIFRF